MIHKAEWIEGRYMLTMCRHMVGKCLSCFIQLKKYFLQNEILSIFRYYCDAFYHVQIPYSHRYITEMENTKLFVLRLFNPLNKSLVIPFHIKLTYVTDVTLLYSNKCNTHDSQLGVKIRKKDLII